MGKCSMAVSPRRSGRTRKAKKMFDPGPSKEQLIYAEKRREGANRLWQARRKQHALSTFLSTTNTSKHLVLLMSSVVKNNMETKGS
mmetsp:Transcript_16719/g.30400  ORF Transcript_16719/g.30400 Transcript_16719/m.30400 type:complete len:86 (-) Transcript_16719:107-364(-)